MRNTTDVEDKRKADAAQRWYNLVGEHLLSGTKQLIYGYIHHSNFEFQRALAYDALKERQSLVRDVDTLRADAARLASRVNVLEAALQPFALRGTWVNSNLDNTPLDDVDIEWALTVGDLRRAAAALSPKDGAE